MAKDRDLRQRTMAFAIAIGEFCETLPDNYKGRHVADQLFRAGTAVAANYRAACRGRSKPDFIAKLGTVIEESDETDFWLEFAAAGRLIKVGTEQKLRVESNELTAIFTQSQITARRNLGR